MDKCLWIFFLNLIAFTFVSDSGNPEKLDHGNGHTVIPSIASSSKWLIAYTDNSANVSVRSYGMLF